mmetsp:Transcript_3999/g.4622  ORF Transcript_3999/g.4622 Transcript_3999/m.4622 type:complete len:381 (+) Transcript_3999:154-1296(+)
MGGKQGKNTLFTPVSVGGIGDLKNRMALAPLTRARATEDGVVGPHHAKYYVQRANAGLVISEATHISEQGIGWWCAPGIYTDAQTEAWKPVTKAVHDAGGKMVLQLWHTGRSSHSSLHNGKLPVSASAIKISSGHVKVQNNENKEYEVPRALETAEVAGVVQDYVNATKNALKAGFDGVEVHGANGYLLDQFFQSKTNKRTDKYGGSIENRLRILKEIFESMEKEGIPMDKVGVRLSPNGVFNDMGSEDYVAIFDAAITLAAEKKIAYVHIMDGLGFGFHKLGEPYTLEMARKVLVGVQGKNPTTKIIGNCGYTKEMGMEAVGSGAADLIAYGRPYIANPDLVRRFKEDIPLREVEGMDHWYSGGSKTPEKGYTDFEPAP